MKKYVLERVLWSVLTLVVITLIVFIMMQAIPGGPFTRDGAVPEEILQVLDEKYNFSAPLIQQYLEYMKGVLTFDFGPSLTKEGLMVTDIFAAGFSYSFIIGVLSVILVIVIGVPIGVVSAWRHSRPLDHLILFFTTLGVAIPSFVTATLIVHVIAGRFNLMPAFGITSAFSYIGPVVALSGYSIAFVIRLTRAGMIDVLNQDYMRSARAFGLKRSKILLKYGLKNVLIPVLTYIGPMAAAVITGSFVIEKIFAIPGMGRYYVESVINRDYMTVMGMTVIYSTFYIVIMLLVDLAYGFLDPRVRLGKEGRV